MWMLALGLEDWFGNLAAKPSECRPCLTYTSAELSYADIGTTSASACQKKPSNAFKFLPVYLWLVILAWSSHGPMSDCIPQTDP